MLSFFYQARTVIQNGYHFGDTVLGSRCCPIGENRSNRNWSVQEIRATLQAVWWNQSNLFDASRSGCYKTVIILATPFWVAGAVQSVKIGIIVIGASNKSGRGCKRSDEINLIYLMYLDLECWKTVLILETLFCVAGAAESVKIGIIVIGASKKSGRRGKSSDEINLIYLM